MTMTDRLPALFDDDDSDARISVPSFDRWYDRWPKKQGKAKARERWAKMSAAERASAWKATPGWVEYAQRHPRGNTFVPMASTWLNQQRWEDDAPELPQVERREAPGMGVIRRMLSQGDDS